MNSILAACTVCLSSEISRNAIVLVQTVAEVTLLDKFRSSVASRILRKSELCVHVVKCTCFYKEIHLKSKIHHTWTWLEAARPPCCLCYRPTVFLHHLPVITMSYRQETFGVALKCVILSKFIFLNCARLKLRNLKWRQSMSVCCDIRLCLLFNDLSISKMDAVTDEWTKTSPGKTKALE